MNPFIKHSVRLFLILGFLSLCSENTKAQFFTRVLDAGPVITDSVLSAGSSWNDYNNDGFLDLFVSESPAHMYKNNGDGTFSSVSGNIVFNPFTTPFGTVMATWADYNNDGYQDLYRANYGLYSGSNPTTPLKDFLFKNNGPPDYQMTLVDLGNDSSFSANATWVDYDNDGDVDLFVFGGRNTNSLFYKNEGADNFTKVISLPFLIKTSFGGTDTWIDYDNDGDTDLYLVVQRTSNKLYKSLLKETGNPDLFEEVQNSVLSNDGSVFDITASWGDYNNDGFFDVHLAVAGGFDKLYLNNGDGTFTDITDSPVVSTAINTSFGAWADYDNDGDIDLVTAHVSNGSTSGSSDLFRNDGNGMFVQLNSTGAGDLVGAVPSPQAGSWGDYDNDGDMDFYVVNFGLPNTISGIPQPNYLFKNNIGNNNNWLIVQCEGVISNRSAIGTVVKVKANINANSLWQKRFISAGALGNTAQADLRAHFGLGNASVVDSLVIEWPSGIVQTITNVNINQILNVVEDVPDGYIRADFTSEQRDTVNSDSLSVQFEDRSFSVEGFPITSWEWDFDDDGITDSDIQNPFWTYIKAGSYIVNLTVSNGILSSTLRREDFIQITGLVPIIDVNTNAIGFGTIQNDIPFIDTTFYVKNIGGASDSIFIALDYQNISEPSVLVINPESFEIAANDSQAVIFTAYPPLIMPGNSFYLPKAIIDSRFGYGTVHFVKPFAFRITTPVSVDNENNGLPNEFVLYNNYPNPFNPITNISYDVSVEAFVKLTVFDLLGRKVVTLVEDEILQGHYETIFDASDLSSGIYIYSLTATNGEKILFTSAKGMILIK